jgi:internalin A
MVKYLFRFSPDEYLFAERALANGADLIPNFLAQMTMLRVLLLFSIGFVAISQQAGTQTLTARQIIDNPKLLHDRLRHANPDYRDQALFEDDPNVGLVGDLSGGGVTDLTPLQGIPFGALDLKGLQISDLGPLKGMPLLVLGLEETAVSDLRPLAGMRIGKLYLNGTAVADLRPLGGMPLTELMLVETSVKDLRPLRGMPIQQLWLSDTPVLDIAPLSECPLVSLTLEGTKVSDLRPLSKMSSLQRLHIGGTKVNDLNPIKGLKLQRLIFTPNNIKTGLSIARSMKTITEIGTTLDSRMPPEKFWQLFDQGRIK